MSQRIFFLFVLFAVANAYNFGRPTFLISMANALPASMTTQQNMPNRKQSSGTNQMYMGTSMPMPNNIQSRANSMNMGNGMFIPSYMQGSIPNFGNGMPISMYVAYPSNMINYVPSFMSMRMPMSRRGFRQRGADVDRPEGLFDLDYPMGMRMGQGWGWGGQMGRQTQGFMMRYNQLESMDLI